MNRLVLAFLLLALLGLNSNVHASQQNVRSLQGSGNGNGNGNSNGNGNGNTEAPTEPEATEDPDDAATEGPDDAATDSPVQETEAPTDPAVETESPTDAVVETESPTDAVVETDAPTTTAPTDAATMASTDSPTDGATSVAPSTDAPTDGASSVSPSTEGPSSVSPSSESPSSESPSTEGPSDAATEGPSDAASVAPSEMDTMQETMGSTEGATEACQETTYPVFVDLQADFPGDNFASCTDDENIEISEAITAALNTYFTRADEEWVGEVNFGEHVFDDSQIVDLIGAGIGQERRLLRGGAAVVRQLEEETCANRGGVECLEGVCRWGCLEALAKDCSEDQSGSTESWSDLGEFVAADLKQLTQGTGNGFRCLGIQNNLEVVVTLDPGTAPETEAPVTRTITDPPFDDSGFEVRVHSEVDVEYFNFGDRTMDASCDVAVALMEIFYQFQEHNLFTSSAYNGLFNGMKATPPTIAYDADEKTLRFVFDSQVYSTQQQPGVDTPHGVAHEMVKGDFHKLLQDMRDAAAAHKGLLTSDGNPCPTYGQVLAGVKSVLFTATGTGDRRRL